MPQGKRKAESGKTTRASQTAPYKGRLDPLDGREMRILLYRKVGCLAGKRVKYDITSSAKGGIWTSETANLPGRTAEGGTSHARLKIKSHTNAHSCNCRQQKGTEGISPRVRSQDPVLNHVRSARTQLFVVHLDRQFEYFTFRRQDIGTLHRAARPYDTR